MNTFILLAQAEATPGMTPLQITFGLVYVLVCLALIGLILTRSSKNEGLSGSMMGGSDTNFRGAKSADDTVDSFINYVAVAFLSMSIGLNFIF